MTDKALDDTADTSVLPLSECSSSHRHITTITELTQPVSIPPKSGKTAGGYNLSYCLCYFLVFSMLFVVHNCSYVIKM